MVVRNFTIWGSRTMRTLANYKPHVEIVSDLEELSVRGLEFFVSQAKKAIKNKGPG